MEEKMVSIENRRHIDEIVFDVARRFKGESPIEIERCLRIISQEALEQKFFSKEELEKIAGSELETLSLQLEKLVKSGKIEESKAKKILFNLKKEKKRLLAEVIEIPIRNNGDAKCLPIMPVIGTNALDISSQMELIGGENEISFEKIKNFYPYGLPKESYWVINTRINEINGKFSPLLIEEAIAYCLHYDILSRRAVLITQSRYWHAMNNWQFMIALIDDKPKLIKTVDYNGEKPTCNPICFFRLIF
ncbi:MAG: hypothetical protein PHG24_02215 [Candidatus Pacebacteria bacterium]|nr:hypothetical protein [Candidatus Paceibacterota bacterium]